MSGLQSNNKNMVVRKRKKKSILPGMIVFIFSFCILITALYFAYKKYTKAIHPLEYSSFVQKYSKENNLSEAFVYSVIKCESSFDPTAVSPIGAIGLMQITEETFEWIKFRMKDSSEEDTVYSDLFDPEKNIKYGTFLLSILIEEFDTEHNALCAYHAGRGSLQKWLKNTQYSQDGKNISYIPFDDTRAYVERVLKIKEIYKELYFQ